MTEDFKSIDTYLGDIRIREMITFSGRTEGKSKLYPVLLKERTITSEPIGGIDYDFLTIDETKGESNDPPRSLVETQENHGSISDE